jgi:hypothetical protein
MQRNSQHPRLERRKRGSVTDYVEKNPRNPQSEEPAKQGRQSQQQQVDEMTPIGTDERPGAYRESKDVARAESARLGKRNFARRRRYCYGD